MLNIFIDFQPEDLGRPSTTGTTGIPAGRVDYFTYEYRSGRVVKTVYPQTSSVDGSCAKHLTVVSYTVVMLLTFIFIIIIIIIIISIA